MLGRPPAQSFPGLDARFIGDMRVKRLREPASDVFHCCFRALESVNSKWEVQGLLNLPDAIVLAGWKHLRRIADRDPANGNRSPRSQVAHEMHNSVDPYLAVLAEMS